MYLKLVVGAFMFNNKGSTLIESLLAFEIFISVLIVLITSLTTIYNHELRLKENYTKILEKEEVLLEKEDFIGLIEEVLH